MDESLLLLLASERMLEKRARRMSNYTRKKNNNQLELISNISEPSLINDDDDDENSSILKRRLGHDQAAKQDYRQQQQQHHHHHNPSHTCRRYIDSIGRIEKSSSRRIIMGTRRGGNALPLLLALGALLVVALSLHAPALTSGEHLQTIRSRRQRDLQLPTAAADMQVTSLGAAGQPTCGYPGSPAHASVTFNTSQVMAGTAASYTCDNGYELLGPPRRLCQANGTWSPAGIPFCVLNVGLGKAAMQSSTAGQGSAQKAVDGSTSPYFQPSTCTMTDVESSPWWYVNLLEPYLVQIVRIDFGQPCCANRQKATIAVRVGNNRPDLGTNPLCNRYHGFIEEGKPLFLPCTRPAPGAFVSIHLEAPSGSALSICETFIYTDHALSIEQCPSFRDQPLGSTATYNGKCYLFHNNQALNFESAHKYCESRGGTLVDETSPALQGFLSWELYRRHRNDQLMGQYWLGAVKDPRQANNWKWINGNDVRVSFWSPSPPNLQHNCSRFDGSKGWLWTDTDCSSQLNFICQYRPLSCGKPEKPTNSTLTSRTIDNGTVIEYQCAPGTFLMGPKSRTCLPTGFFSEFAPKCKYVDCQFPAMIANGDYKLLNGTTTYQSVVNYYCQDGHQLYGKSTLQCDTDERWNGPPPRCEPLLCSAPVPPSNGYVTVSSNITIPGTQATYDCRPGYELVGERLLTCASSGSWDNSFPYCRERRLLVATATTPAPTATRQRPLTSFGGPQRLVPGSVQFPSSGPAGIARPQTSTSSSLSPSSSTAASTTSTSTTTTTTTTTTSTASPPTTTASAPTASLNGLAGQFVAQQPAISPVQAAPMSPAPPQPATPQASPQPASLPAVGDIASSFGSPLADQQRKASQSSSVSQFALPPSVGDTSTRFVPRPQLTASTAPSAFSQSPSSLPPTTATSSVSTSPTSSSSSSTTTTSTRQQQNSFRPNDGGNPAQAATNSFNVHSNPAHTVSSVIPSQLTTAPTTSTQFVGSASGQGNLQASFAAPQPPRSFGGAGSNAHLASTKYSLDGIIAVAIFGGFIFLGAIITIIVIIIRRKSSHSSSIDAQTISTYDSQGEHNGLYRNYQQAWENLRFAAPNSQPKSSGGGTGLSSAAPVVGLKNFGSPVHHAHAHHLHHAHLLNASGAAAGGGQHNLAMASSSGSSSSGSSQSSSLGGVQGDPLLRPSAAHSHLLHAHHPHPHLHPHHHRHHHNEEEEEDDEVGVLSSDENTHQHHHHVPHHHHQQQHHHHHHHHHNYSTGNESQQHNSEQVSLAGEGFRDSNELTINADTCPAPQTVTGNVSNVAARRHSNDSQGQLVVVGHRRGPSGASSSQRLVSSSTPSASTHSSRASPPSADDDHHSLDRLAYGNQWHPNGASAVAAGASRSSDSASSNQGSGASMLGGRGPQLSSWVP